MTANSRPAALEIHGVSKTFGGRRVLDRLSLRVAAGEVHALVGENGSGKSTLIKILSGYQSPDDNDAGLVHVAGAAVRPASPAASYQAGCRFVHQDLGLVESASVLDNLCLPGGYTRRFGTIRPRRTRTRARSQVEAIGLDIDVDAKLQTLSAAQKAGVAIARAMRSDERYPLRLLVLDEPTATLSEPEVRSLSELIRRVAEHEVGVLFVSHRFEEVFALAERVSVLRDGVNVGTRAIENLTRLELIELVAGKEAATLHEPATAPTPALADRAALAVSHLETDTLDGISFDVRPGEILGFAGITGSGRDQVLSTVFGGQPRHSGEVRSHRGVVPPARPDQSVRHGIGYLPPDRRRLGGLMSLSARENLTLADVRSVGRIAWLGRRREASASASWFKKLDIRPGGAVDQLLKDFSGGNQQKVLFAKWLRLNPAVFLLDEPTQGVDVAAKALLHRQLQAAASGGMAVLLASSDIEELASLCTRVLVLRAGRLVDELRTEGLTVMRLTRSILAGEDTGS